MVKTYKEYVGASVVMCTETACPDDECQKIVDTQLAREKNKRTEIRRESEKREIERQKKLHKKRSN